MSRAVRDWARACPVRSNGKLVLIILAERADAGGVCFPSIDLLATETGLSERTVQRAIKALEGAGLVAVERSSGWHRPSRYVLLFAGQGVTNTTGQGVTTATCQGVTNATSGVTNTTKFAPKMGKSPRVNPLTSWDSEASKEVSKSPPIVPHSAFSSADALFGGPPPLPERPARRLVLVNGKAVAFATFWAGYPKKVAKGDAERAYLKALTIATPEAILAGLDRSWGPRRFIPNPATWLNGQRWLDEPEYDPVLRAAGLDRHGHMISEVDTEESSFPRLK